MSSKNVLLRSYAISPAVAGLTSSRSREAGIPAAVLLGRLGPLLLLPLAALIYFCCFRQIAVRGCGTWTAGLPFGGLRDEEYMEDYPVRSGAEKSLLDAVLAAYRRVLDDPGVSPDDDFFELGGDSFQAMDLMAALEKTTGKQINAGAIFVFPTAAGLAKAITNIADART